MDLKESIKKHEGFKAKPYPDPIKGWDVPTFGIGFTYITESEADYILDKRIKELRSDLAFHKSIFKVMPDEVKDVLVEMAFQLGVAGLLKFKNMWHHLSFREYDKAANEMLNSKWAKQVPNRAKSLADRVRSYAEV